MKQVLYLTLFCVCTDLCLSKTAWGESHLKVPGKVTHCLVANLHESQMVKFFLIYVLVVFVIIVI